MKPNYRKRYIVANESGIPFYGQPENGYTYLQAIARVQREIQDCARLFGGNYADYKTWFLVLDNHFNTVKDAILDY